MVSISTPIMSRSRIPQKDPCSKLSNWLHAPAHTQLRCSWEMLSGHVTVTTCTSPTWREERFLLFIFLFFIFFSFCLWCLFFCNDVHICSQFSNKALKKQTGDPLGIKMKGGARILCARLAVTKKCLPNISNINDLPQNNYRWLFCPN